MTSAIDGLLVSTGDPCRLHHEMKRLIPMFCTDANGTIRDSLVSKVALQVEHLVAVA